MGLMIFLRQCIVMLQPYTLRAPKMKVYNVRQAEFYEHLWTCLWNHKIRLLRIKTKPGKQSYELRWAKEYDSQTIYWQLSLLLRCLYYPVKAFLSSSK